MKIDYKSLTKKYTRPEKGLFPVGSRVYIGRQGKGKTLSMVKYIHDLKLTYPDMQIFSNVILYGLEYHHLNEPSDVELALAYQNGNKGVLVVLDEAHLYFNSKQGIPVDVLTAISQQRKDRRRIVFSSQIWNELDISIRKQVQDVVICKNIGRLQFNKIMDGESIRLDKSDYSYEMDKRYSELYKHNDEYYSRYDTFQKIVTNKDYSRLPLNNVVVPIPQKGKKHA
ncbi:MAG: hypothetical protein EOO17_03365 [Chloroflexi bacterium]|nr:MAG: hypothetical protein EOO17_03365 [Chloroflexota bacterium]